MSDNDENIDEIRKDIEDTRQRISSDIEAIEGKLTPEYARHVVSDTVKETAAETRERVMERAHETRELVADRVGEAALMVRSNATRVGADFGAAVRANPIPVAMIGLGAGWLVWETFRPLRASEELDVEPLVDLDIDVEGTEVDYAIGGSAPIGSSSGYGTPEYGASGYASEIGARAGNGMRHAKDRAQHAKDRALHAKDRFGSVARDAKGRVSTASHDVKDRASHLAHDVKDRASHLAHVSRDRSRELADRSRERALRARDASNEAFDANPVAFGALALLAGIGLGYALPHTRREDQLLGASREKVVHRARRLAHDARQVAIDSVKEGAKAAKEHAKVEAEDRNLIR